MEESLGIGLVRELDYLILRVTDRQNLGGELLRMILSRAFGKSITTPLARAASSAPLLDPTFDLLYLSSKLPVYFLILHQHLAWCVSDYY